MKNIEHLADIITINNHMVEVKMVVNSACVSCKASSSCGASESVDKIVVVFVDEPHLFKLGEQVMVTITQTMGIKAIFYAYMLPFILLFSSLLLTLGLGLSESTSGLASLAVVGLYYIMVYALRERLDKEIIFNLRKI